MYPATSKLSATIVTTLAGVVTALYPDGKAIDVKQDQLVLQLGSTSAKLIDSLKVGSKLKISNDYKIKKDLTLFSAFGNRQNLMINGVIVARCSPASEDIRPRNAMGWNENGDVWFATTTMGVRNSADVFNRFRLGGSTVHQLTSWLKELGATQAIMLDGGGSTTMYVQTPEADYKRVDLPASEWVRTVPQGIGMVAR
jgi:exopolysaccharide biosynthesis protein